MPWISRSRLAQTVADAKTEAQIARDEQTMKAFRTLWPKHARSLTAMVHPYSSDYPSDYLIYRGWCPEQPPLDTKCIDFMIDTAKAERDTQEAARKEQAEADQAKRVKERADRLRSGVTSPELDWAQSPSRQMASFR